MSLLNFTVIVLIIIHLLHGLQVGANSVEIENGGEVKETAKKNAKKRSSKNWSKVDFNSLEKEWEGGDDEEETESEYEKIRRVRKEKLAKSGDDQSIMSKLKKDPLGLNFGSGGSMMFAKLKSNVKWSNDEVNKIAKQWKGLLLSSGTDVNVVNIGSFRCVASSKAANFKRIVITTGKIVFIGTVEQVRVNRESLTN